jgi:hypothetical protein
MGSGLTFSRVLTKRKTGRDAAARGSLRTRIAVGGSRALDPVVESARFIPR